VGGTYEGEAVMKLLLAKDGVTLRLQGEQGRTPLLLTVYNAVPWGSEGEDATMSLLAKSENYNGDNSYEKVVKLLLATNLINAESNDEYGRTLLSYTAWRGYEGVAKLLLATDGVPELRGP
jgi:ankyrin repeat protein